jgi:hypothetical protein
MHRKYIAISSNHVGKLLESPGLALDSRNVSRIDVGYMGNDVELLLQVLCCHVGKLLESPGIARGQLTSIKN